MKDPTWINEAAEAAVGAFMKRTAPATREEAMDHWREIARAVLAVEDLHDCRGPADRASA